MSTCPQSRECKSSNTLHPQENLERFDFIIRFLEKKLILDGHSNWKYKQVPVPVCSGPSSITLPILLLKHHSLNSDPKGSSNWPDTVFISIALLLQW